MKTFNAFLKENVYIEDKTVSHGISSFAEALDELGLSPNGNEIVNVLYDVNDDTFYAWEGLDVLSSTIRHSFGIKEGYTFRVDLTTKVARGDEFDFDSIFPDMDKEEYKQRIKRFFGSGIKVKHFFDSIFMARY